MATIQTQLRTVLVLLAELKKELEILMSDLEKTNLEARGPLRRALQRTA